MTFEWDARAFRENEEHPRWAYRNGIVSRGNVGMFLAGPLSEGVAAEFMDALNTLETRLEAAEELVLGGK